MENEEIVKQEIRAVELAWKGVFSTKSAFNPHLSKWQDDVLYDMYDNNAFIPVGDILTLEDFEQAIAYQKARKLNFIKFDSRAPLGEPLLGELNRQFGLEGYPTDTMYLRESHPERWKHNPAVEIRDVKNAPIADALKEIELTNYGARSGEDFIRRKMNRYTAMAMQNPDFHYYGAFLNGKIAGACYAYVKNGYILLDELIVNEELRRQAIASTLMARIAGQFSGTLFLHADPDDTPREMYAKMGFVVIDTIYEYIAKLP